MTDAHTPSNDVPVPGHRSRWSRIVVGLTVGAVAAGTGIIAATSADAETPAAGTAVVPARFEQQKPVWRPCSAETPAEFECATITVPLDYRRPDGTAIDVAISRIRTSVPAKRRGILLFNPGGPGVSGLHMPLMRDELPQDVRDQFDLVGFDPRGVGESSPVTCGLTGDELNLVTPYKPETFATDVARNRTVAAKCAKTDAKMPYITTRNTARDMDVIRAVLGEKKLSYLGISYGTYLGAVYMQLFPQRSDRIVLDSGVDPAFVWRGTLQSWAVGSKPAFERWTEWTAKRDAQYGLGSTAAAVSKTFWNLVARANTKPIETPDQAWTGEELRFFSREGVFFVQQQAAVISGLKKAADGIPVDPAPVAARSPLTERDGVAEQPSDNAEAAILALYCNDVTNWPRDPEQYRRDAIRDKQHYPLAGDAMSNIAPCAFWTVPHIERSSTVRNSVASLVVQNEWDPQTPSYMGLGMHRALTGSRLVFVDEGEGHGVYGLSGNKCAYQAVNAYLGRGALPGKDLTCMADPAPQTAKPVPQSERLPVVPNTF